MGLLSGARAGALAGVYAGAHPDLRSPFRLVLDLAAGRPVFTADFYIEDPLHAGFVYAFVDHNDYSHWLVQTDQSRQVEIPLPHADFGGKLCANFTGTQFYESNRTTAYWGWLHAGTPVHLSYVLTSTVNNVTVKDICATAITANGLRTYQFLATSRTGVSNATLAVIPDASDGALAVDVPTYHTLLHGSGLSPQFSAYVKSTLARSGSYAAAPGPGASSFPFRLGGATGMVARWREVFMSDDVSTGTLQTYRQYVQSAYGIPP